MEARLLRRRRTHRVQYTNCTQNSNCFPMETAVCSSAPSLRLHGCAKLKSRKGTWKHACCGGVGHIGCSIPIVHRIQIASRWTYVFARLLHHCVCTAARSLTVAKAHETRLLRRRRTHRVQYTNCTQNSNCFPMETAVCSSAPSLRLHGCAKLKSRKGTWKHACCGGVGHIGCSIPIVHRIQIASRWSVRVCASAASLRLHGCEKPDSRKGT